ncbi:tubulin folding cofactor D C terminal-domain-containing protein [Blyttiomyces helicus]|uniref:Tubulin folding cofactor D C terminal-domain-containing protein n=1 Tax=Blyttiomyces helicus TaxID=388810 RepID=A0A4P9WEI8_9FUNG|nr:tubulin folding cofactor D C terminal-domain-containing protein [Blyttiomyces helicus]|eukprot:RKO90123.1 tubulin folding cofactor D C terminal-domain-containing protein [Blyttiomyces helicus]
MDSYQEQPHLLDTHLESLITPVVEKLRATIFALHDARDASSPFDVSNETLLTVRPLFGFLYLLSKVRGYKIVVKFFTHEVADLEPILDFLEMIGRRGNTPMLWEMRYILLLWLSLICMVPFDLRRVDSGVGKDTVPLVDRILALGRSYLFVVGKEHEAATVLMTKVLTRRDTSPEQMREFLEFASTEACSTEDVFKLRGSLYAICALYKHSPRELLLPTLSVVLPCLSLIHHPWSKPNALVRKLVVKLAQRIGLCHMKPRIAAWRYQRGCRSLSQNLGKQGGAQQQWGAATVAGEAEEEADIPEALDEVCEILLTGLRDRDTTVRWSSAKGVGRIANRLPQDLARDVILSVLSLFEEDTVADPDAPDGIDLSQVSDYTWHGACLALAELARHGLLLPDMLVDTVPWIMRALQFDQRRGTHSVGAHVRDAACYVCWSFARAYDPAVMKPFVVDLACSLAVVSVCDREVNVRRASSAAFQENVGRQGTFPHGIEIVTTADYFAVGNRAHSFLEISVEVARHEEYRHRIFHHMATVSVMHWDRTIRDLAAKALGKYVAIDEEYMINIVLALLIPKTADKELSTRHGALLAVGEICVAWSSLRRVNIAVEEWWTPTELERFIKPILAIIPTYPQSHLDNFDGDLTRIACCNLIACATAARLPLPEVTLASWWSLIDSTLTRRMEQVSAAAAAVVGPLGLRVESVDPARIARWVDIVSRPPVGVGDADRFARRGFALGLGAVPGVLLGADVERVLLALGVAAGLMEVKTLNDAETRRNAVKGLTNIMLSFGDDLESSLLPTAITKCLETLLSTLSDYAVDARGDVGSWVRIASLQGLARIAPRRPEIERELIGALCRQAVEKIGRVREAAGRALFEAVWGRDVPAGEALRAALKSPDQPNWNDPAEVFPLMIRVLDVAEYRVDLLTGLVVSIGGLTESLVRESSTSLVTYTSSLPVSSSTTRTTLPAFLTALLTVFATHARNDRVTVPIFEVLDLLISAGVVARCPDVEMMSRLGALMKGEVVKCKDAKKLLAGMKV